MLRSLILLMAVGTAAASGAACSLLAAPIPGSHVSVQQLGTAVLAALEHRDEKTLRLLALDEDEFRKFIWPDLPAARPERNLPFSYVWGDLRQKSNLSLGRTLAEHGGRHYTLLSIDYLDGTTPYKSYLVHRQAVINARDADGAFLRLRLFGSVVEKAGRFKVFSYVVDK